MYACLKIILLISSHLKYLLKVSLPNTRGCLSQIIYVSVSLSSPLRVHYS